MSKRARLFRSDKMIVFASCISKKKLFFSKVKFFFFSTFQSHETKSIENIFAFNIICFSVYTKFISILLVLDFVVFVLVIAFVLCLVLFLLQLQNWYFLFAQQQQLILVLVLVLVLVLARTQNQFDVKRFLLLMRRLHYEESSLSFSHVQIWKILDW